MMINLKYLIGAAAGLAVGALLVLVAGPWTTSAESARQSASNTVVACEPSQQVVVRHTVVNNELQVATECVGAAAGLMPAVYRPQAVASPLAARTVSAPRTQAATSTRRAATQDSKRSWTKTALVIGGSAGAGAGIGALANGKKGALIGTAIGAGAGAIFEAIQRRK